MSGLPTPYFDDGQVAIYCGDAVEIVPQLSLAAVDVVLTDPPYGINGGHGTINRVRGKGVYGALFRDDREYVELTVVPLIAQMVARVRCVVVTPGNKWFALYPPADSFGAFYQPAASSLQVFGNLDAQPILYYGKNASGRNMGVPCSYVLTEPPPPGLDHPCPKPFVAWKRLLSNVSQPGQMILDPFMGSGTTIRAALDLGRRAIGIEINEAYCAIAVERLRQGVLL